MNVVNHGMNLSLSVLDSDLAAAIAAGDDAKVAELAEEFEQRGLGTLAAVLREKGAAGLRAYLGS